MNSAKRSGRSPSQCCVGAFIPFAMFVVSLFLHGGKAGSANFEVRTRIGAVIYGQPTPPELTLQSGEERRRIPLEDVQHFTPGLYRQPALVKRVRRLVENLASDNFLKRETAHQELQNLGPAIQVELEPFREDDNAERRHRIKWLLQHFDQHSLGVISSRDDRLRLHEEVVSGRLQQETLQFKTKYGNLEIPLKEISAMRQSSAPARINLLDHVDLQRGAVRGEWKVDRGVLVTPPDQPWALLQLGVKAPGSYTIRATVERKAGHDAIVFPILVGEHECNVCIDGWPRGGVHHSGLELIRGHGPLTNETRHRGDLLPMDKPTSLEVAVTTSSVRLVVAGQQIFHWEGDPAVFSMQEGWDRPSKIVLGLGSYNASFRITRLELAGRVDYPPITDPQPGDCSLVVRDGSRLILRPTDRHQVLLKANSATTRLLLTDVIELVSIEGKPCQKTVQTTDGKVRSGELQGVLEFETEFGRLRLPASEIVAIVCRSSKKAKYRSSN